jgi:hypothetical protein
VSPNAIKCADLSCNGALAAGEAASFDHLVLRKLILRRGDGRNPVMLNGRIVDAVGHDRIAFYPRTAGGSGDIIRNCY